ncbi:hypothetical protein P3S68_007401 [Capsicum galapagoense]
MPPPPTVSNLQENIDLQEVEDALELMRETRMEIHILKEIKVLVFKKRFVKKAILICPPFLRKTSLDIRIPSTPEIGNFVVVMNPTLMEMEPSQEKGSPNKIPQTMNRSMDIIIWNCRGFNGSVFRRNFRAIIDWHKPPLVALLKTKMQNHQVFLNIFPFNKMTEVPAIRNFEGIAVLWDDNFLELDNIATNEQKIHAMVKGITPQAGGPVHST